MKWVRVGQKRINLCHTITVEGFDGLPDTAELQPGGAMVTLLTGRTLVFPPGPEVDALFAAVDEEVAALPPGPPGAVVHGTAVDPASGEALTPPGGRVERR